MVFVPITAKRIMWKPSYIIRYYQYKTGMQEASILFFDGHPEIEQLWKGADCEKFFYRTGDIFVLAGIVFCAADTKDTSARAQALYDAPVVTMQDLEEWKNQDTQQEVVVTQIPLTGDLVSDPRKFLDGQFYYLKVEKWVYQKEEDEDSSGWEKKRMVAAIQSGAIMSQLHWTIRQS